MSTTMPPAATAWKTLEQIARLIRQVEDRDPALVGVQEHVADHDVFHAGQALSELCRPGAVGPSSRALPAVG